MTMFASSIPLNIDWQQILLHVFNFIILATVLTFVLFKPVRKFMREREEKYKNAAEEHAKKKAEIEELEEQRKEKLAGLDAELETHRREVMAQTEKRSRQLISDAESEARDILAQGRKRSEEERKAYIAGAGDEIADMVVKSAEKLLVVGSSPESDKALYDSYLKTASQDITVSGVSKEAKETLASRLARISERGKGEKTDAREDMADVVGEAALAAMERGRTAESDGAVYDEFLKSVGEGKDGK